MPQRRFRPTLESLDGRIVPSSMAIPGLKQLHVSRTDPAVTPKPFNTSYTPDAWEALHGGYDAEAKADKAPIVFLGDSITYFWNSNAEPELGQSVWNKTFAPLKAENFGILGDETQNLLWRVENGELAGKPKVAVVMIGINNLLQGETPEETAAGVSAVVQAIHARSPRTHVLLMGILPVNTYYTRAPLSEVQTANAEIARYVRGPGTTFLDLSSKFVEPDGQINLSLYKFDGIHPGAAGYQLLADSIAPTISKWLGPSAFLNASKS